MAEASEQMYSLTVLFHDGTHTVIKPFGEAEAKKAFEALTFDYTAIRLQADGSESFHLINPAYVKLMTFEPI